MVAQSNTTSYPKILVVSNNAFSETSNNGKTLASFFENYPVGKIAQLYFNPEFPSVSQHSNFYRITDNDVVRSLLSRNKDCGKRVGAKVNIENTESNNRNSILVNKIKKYNLTRIIRESFWKRKTWKTESFEQWLNDFSPEIIFFCAGDSGFAYDITKYIQKKFDSKLVVYITDDYILPRKTVSLFWWLRRNEILKKMKNTVQRSDLFITISKEMKETYKELFNKDSILAVNMTHSMKEQSYEVDNSDKIILLYAGGLHYKRYLTLNLLAHSLKKYNEASQNNKKKVLLKIYSGQEPSNGIKKYLNVEGTSEYCGKLNPQQLKKELNSCHIPVHVESFDQKSIESTRLSISTKIPEYLSLGKPVLAIGPKEVASMKYLKNTAYCITDNNNIESKLINFLNDSALHKDLSQKALYKYEKNHNRENVIEQLISSIISIK